MKTVFVSLSVLLLSGCSAANTTLRFKDEVLAVSVNAYCRLPEPVRLANRARIAAKIAPHRIEIQCHGEG